MTPKTVAIGAALALVSVSAGVSAQEGRSWVSGNELKEFCHSEYAYGQGICIGYAMATASAATRGSLRVCIPSGQVTRGQLQDIMVKYLDDHPATLHDPAPVLAFVAFYEAFPCPK